MANLNRVMLIGRLGKDPALTTTTSGINKASFSLATSEKFKNQNGEYKTNVEWHNCIAWRNIADLIVQYCFKGSQVYVEGKINTAKWEDAEGNKKEMKQIIVSSIQFLDSKNETKKEINGNIDSNNIDYQQSSLDDDIPF